MARISNYALDTALSQDDRILGSSYEGMSNNKPVYKTRTYKISELSDYFSNNFNVEGVNYNINEIQNYIVNLANSLGDPNQDGSLTNISISFANDLVAKISTVPDIFTELALSNISAVPQEFADFLFSIANINETFANQVLDLATSTAYTTVDTFDALSAFVTQINSNVQGLEADITSITGNIDTLTGSISANAVDLEALGIRVTTAETDVVALETDFTSLTITVNEQSGRIDANATSLESLGTVINTTNANVAALQTSVTTLESFVDNTSGDVSALASEVDLLTTNVNTIGIDVTAVQTDVTALTTTVNQNTNDISTQATQVSLLANRVDTTETDILNTKTDVTQLTSTVEGNTGNIATNASNISILQTNVYTAQADIVGIITDIQQIETSVDNVTGDIEANAIAITGLATRVTTAEADVVNVAGNITTLQTDLNTQTGRIDTNVQSIDTLGTIVTDNFTTLNASITTVNNARISGDTALSTRIDNIESQITNIPVTIRQNEEPGILDINNELIYPLGSIWVDTDDSNAIYILIEDAGAPSGYAWSPTTSEALGDLILSNAQLETEVNTLTTNLNAESTKVETLTSQFGFYDPATNTFTIDNNAAVVSDLRTYADAESAAASKVDSVGSAFGAFNPTTNAFTVSNAKLETIVDTLTLANYASTTRVDTLEAEVDGNAASIINESTARANGDSALSSQISTVASNVGGLTTTVQQHTSSINGIEGRYGVTIDQNGNIAGFQLLNGTGGSAFNVSVDSFNIYSGTTNANVFTVDSGQVKLNVPLNGVSGTFTGTLQAGGVRITNDTITLTQLPTFDISSNILFNNSSGSQVGEIKVIDISSSPIMFINAARGLTVNTNTSDYFLSNSFMANGNGVATSTAQIREFLTVRLEETSGNSVYLDAAGVYLATSNGTFFFVQDNIISCGNATADVIFNVNGAPVSGGGPTTDTNYYLQGVSINNSNGVITFDMNGTTDKTVDISTYVSNRLPNLSGYALLSGATFSGNVFAPDFILSSDIKLKENIKDYAVKPININYKSYNLIGDDQERVGVIAQELEVEHPEFVRENEEGIKSVSYIDMLVAKVAELEARIKELEYGGRK